MKYDISHLTNEEIEGMILDLQHTLAHRRQVARKDYIKNNPILGFSLHNDGAWKCFWETNDALAKDFQGLDDYLREGFFVQKVRNPELKELLSEGCDLVYFNPSKNTASGEEHPLANTFI